MSHGWNHQGDIFKFLLSLLLLVLTACGGGGGGQSGGSGSTLSDLSIGQLVDGPVSGLNYTSGQQTGITDSTGLYIHQLNGPVTFSVGGIVLGTADPTGKSILTPIDMVPGAVDATHPAVINILRFLQTIDDDANHNNGIDITAAVRALAANQTVNFNQSVTAFQQDPNVLSVISILTAQTSAGSRSLVSATSAQNNFSQSLLLRRIGGYCAIYSGNDAGTLDFTIDFTGNISGTGTSNSLGAMTLSGSVDNQGNVVINSSVSGIQTATFTGLINTYRNLSGIWSDTSNNTGTVTGARSGVPCNQYFGGNGSVTGAVQIEYEIYDGLFRYEMSNLNAPVDVLQPYIRTLVLKGAEMRAEDDGVVWMPTNFSTPPVFGRVPFVNLWVKNLSGIYQFNQITSVFDPVTQGGSVPNIVFSNFLAINVSTLSASISVGNGTVTGTRIGTMSFDGKQCTHYSLSSAQGSASEVCLAKFSGVNDAVALYYKAPLSYTDPNGAILNFDVQYVATKVNAGVSVDSSTFSAP